MVEINNANLVHNIARLFLTPENWILRDPVSIIISLLNMNSYNCYSEICQRQSVILQSYFSIRLTWGEKKKNVQNGISFGTESLY